MPALPESVRRAAELSNQLQQKARAGTLTLEDTAMTPDQVQMPVGQPAMPVGFQPQAAGTGVPGLGTREFNPQPAEAPGQPPRAAAPTPPAPAEEPAAEQRFKVLQGKYNAEVPRLHQQVKQSQAQIDALQNQLSATQALLAGFAQTPSAAQPPPQPSLVTDKDTKEFGADLVDLMQRVAQQTVGPKIRILEEQFRPVAQTVQQMAPMVQQTAENSQHTANEVAEEKLYNGLDLQVPAWEAVNSSPEFGAWLQQQDPYAGAIRGAMLAQAFKSRDLPRVVAFFTGFMKEHAAVAPTGQQQPSTPAGQTQPGTPTVSLASLAAPGTGVGGPVNAGAPNETGQQRVYTQSEIAAFYKDVSRGAYRGRDADKQAIEKDIFLASKTGRVRP